MFNIHYCSLLYIKYDKRLVWEASLLYHTNIPLLSNLPSGGPQNDAYGLMVAMWTACANLVYEMKTHAQTEGKTASVTVKLVQQTRTQLEMNENKTRTFPKEKEQLTIHIEFGVY